MMGKPHSMNLEPHFSLQISVRMAMEFGLCPNRFQEGPYIIYHSVGYISNEVDM